MEYVRIKGLMTMAPYECPERNLEKYFQGLMKYMLTFQKQYA